MSMYVLRHAFTTALLEHLVRAHGSTRAALTSGDAASNLTGYCLYLHCTEPLWCFCSNVLAEQDRCAVCSPRCGHHPSCIVQPIIGRATMTLSFRTAVTNIDNGCLRLRLNMMCTVSAIIAAPSWSIMMMDLSMLCTAMHGLSCPTR